MRRDGTEEGVSGVAGRLPREGGGRSRFKSGYHLGSRHLELGVEGRGVYTTAVSGGCVAGIAPYQERFCRELCCGCCVDVESIVDGVHGCQVHDVRLKEWQRRLDPKLTSCSQPCLPLFSIDDVDVDVYF